MSDADTWTFEFESDFAQGEAIIVKLQSGSSTFVIGEGADASTETEVRKHIFSVSADGYSQDHLGGLETRDGSTTEFSENWERGASSISIGDDTPKVAEDSTAYSLYSVDGGDVFYTENTWTSDFGGQETERSYFDANGKALGFSHSRSDDTSSDVQYQGADYSFLGSERTDEFGSESRFETPIAKFESQMAQQ